MISKAHQNDDDDDDDDDDDELRTVYLLQLAASTVDCLLARTDCLLAASAGLPGSIHGGMCLQTDAQTQRRTFTHTVSDTRRLTGRRS